MMSLLRVFHGDGDHSTRHELHRGSTLSAVYWRYYRPLHLESSGAADGNYQAYEIALKLWIEITGDPPLAEIDAYCAARFVSGLRARTYRGERIAANTVRKHGKQIQFLLDACLPPRRERRDRPSAGLLEDVPYLKLPPEETSDDDVTYTLEELASIFAATPRATGRRDLPVPADRWWEAFLLFTFNTGFRLGTMLTIEWPMVAADRTSIRVPLRSLKGKRAKRQPLNVHAAEALGLIAPAGAAPPAKRIFPWGDWPRSKTSFYKHWGLLLAAAGLPKERRLGVHALRRLHVTEMVRISEFAAQKSAGHHSARLTCERYTAGTHLTESLARLRQPERTRQMHLFE